ncbi:hypothetical protein AKJ49_01905 [candidate division MSBL1 archaeon SCGC-AAA382A03]|uniref:histidine kinase n=1 Tax=candidate division MSBL1 archaeon SCGC-AAA382A03 TaxID=1698278 RepID=A0A133VDY1_9EURY|nr:hypothetical protein AKJ49_01905 [candidate division MSBL1 archaeon SCGC-AAA382A03]
MSLLSIEDGFDLIEKIDIVQALTEVREPKETDLDAVVKDVLNSKKDLLKKNNIDLEIEKNNITVKAGPLLKDLLSNLIEESVKHENAKKIHIYSKEGKKRVILILENDGTGVPEIVKKGFETCYLEGQVKPPGLLLCIAREIIDQYQGKFEIKDSELGGARFDIHLKKAQ